jgi:hypothetical protein
MKAAFPISMRGRQSMGQCVSAFTPLHVSKKLSVVDLTGVSLRLKLISARCAYGVRYYRMQTMLCPA